MTVAGSQMPSTRITLLKTLQGDDNEDAWREFVDIYTPMIYGFAKKKGLQHDDCLNVAQETLLQVNQSIKKFRADPERGSLRGWLGTITYRTMCRIGSFNRPQFEQLDSANADELAGAEDSEWHVQFREHVLRHAIERVEARAPEDQFRAFEMAWLKNTKPREVAARLGRTVGWVHQAKFQLLRQLEREVEFLSDEGLH